MPDTPVRLDTKRIEADECFIFFGLERLQERIFYEGAAAMT